MVNGNHEIYKSSSLFIRINFIMQINAEKLYLEILFLASN